MVERWALVSAGSQGLGEAISDHLAHSGYAVIAHFHESQGRAEALSSRVRGRGGRIYTEQADLATSAGREAFMRKARAHSSALHLLVNNLGAYPSGDLLDATIDTFERAFALTCAATFHLTQLSLPMLRAAAPGANVINIGDSGCDRITARPHATAYHIAKLGVHLLTKTYAQRLMTEGIRVNMVSPGFLENSVGSSGELPAGRMGKFDDVLGALDYLLSERAAYVSGANLVVSGAWNLGT